MLLERGTPRKAIELGWILRVKTYDETVEFKRHLKDTRVVSLPCDNVVRWWQGLTNSIGVL